jgi:hypothetical protein
VRLSTVDFGFDAFLFQGFRGLQCLLNHGSRGDEGQVLSRPLDVGFSQWDQVFILGNRSFQV